MLTGAPGVLVKHKNKNKIIIIKGNFVDLFMD